MMRRTLTAALLLGLGSMSCTGHRSSFLPLLGQTTGRTSIPVVTVSAPIGIAEGNRPTHRSLDQIAGVLEADVRGDDGFSFQTTRQVRLDLTILDPEGPVAGAIVTVTDPAQTDRVVFQGVTDSAGRLTGQATTANVARQLDLSIVAGDSVVNQGISVAGIQAIIRTVSFTQPINIKLTADADADGVPDDLDAYPRDAGRSALLIEPTSAVAFSDRFQKVGRPEYNDLVLQVKNERDLDASGRVVRLRGFFRVLARGTDSSHNILLKLPGQGNVHFLVKDGAGNVKNDTGRSLTSFQSLPVFPKETGYFTDMKPGSNALFDSATLCPGVCNVEEGATIVPGYQAELEIVFDEPISTSELARAPYDLFLYVKGSAREVHLPGLYVDAKGKDLYLSDSGIPWALSIPVEWNWPLEGMSIDAGYPRYRSWYESAGVSDRDWYLQTTPESERSLFRYYSRSPIAAYFLQFGLTHRSLLWAFMAIMLTGLIALLFLKGRSEYEA